MEKIALLLRKKELFNCNICYAFSRRDSQIFELFVSIFSFKGLAGSKYLATVQAEK